ncbi:MAG TPA: carboxypeptidase-like regulatory domain-containing protein [Vicinamibacterales bacterium]|jgi:protocatechuate 3,4-dioxygenase beta subunit|nr:carboxypeptidase-like regulatory domain-containing protein [Vicinamibacterales bacterium]
MTLKTVSCIAALAALTAASGLAQPPQQPPQGQTSTGAAQPQAQGRGGQRQQPRDRATIPAGTSAIAGRVLTADTGRPVKRARVTVSGAGRGGRTATTDDQGRFRVIGLSAGAYTVIASKNGFVDAVFGQRRPLQPGTPVQLADAQEASNVDLRLTRGGVITGRVSDEDGEPLARAIVTVQRYQYNRGERQLTSAGSDQTDDRGQYRVFGLPPGDYYVSATVTGLGEALGRGLQQLAAGLGALGAGRGGRGGFAGSGAPDDPEPSGYAPTYFPGVVSAPDAGRITVAPGEEVLGIDFQIQLVPFATVSGVVAGAEDVVPVLLVPQDAGSGGPMGGQILTGRSQIDGTFSVANVPPGRYLAVARSGGGRGGGARIAVQQIVVNGQNVGGVTLTMQSGVTLSGNITVESSGTPAPADYSSFRVNAPEVNPLPIGGAGRGFLGGGGRVDKNGSFQIPNLVPGRHYIRLTGQGQGSQTTGQWTLKSVMLAGQDVTDQPVDIKPGQNVDNVTILLTDRSTEIAGTVRDAAGAPMGALTVVAFSSDPQYWRAQSRQIQAVRTDQTGAYRLRNLPPGEYLMVATDDVEQGEWFDPAYLEQARAKATRVRLNEGEKKTQDLTGPAG